jgi:TetR/AcrR family transcriptional repressor of nem operon
MRVSKDEKAKSHAAIVKTAAAMMRQNGILQTGVSDVMQAAGMTHGGFYRHFKTKDDLTAAAIAFAFDQTLENLETRVNKDGARDAAKRYAQHYLSAGHVNNAAAGCPVAALGTDGARLNSDVRQIFGDGAMRTVNAVAKAMPSQSQKQSLQVMATLVGAVVIARSVGDHPIGKKVLAACRELVEDSLSKV